MRVIGDIRSTSVAFKQTSLRIEGRKKNKNIACMSIKYNNWIETTDLVPHQKQYRNTFSHTRLKIKFFVKFFSQIYSFCIKQRNHSLI